MTDVNRLISDVSVWVPDQLSVFQAKAKVAYVGAVRASNQADDNRLPPRSEAQVDPEIIFVDPAAAQWLVSQVHDSVETALTVHDVLLQGRDLDADSVLRSRTIHRGVMLRSELRWSGPSLLLGDSIVKLADTHRRLLASSGDETRTLRFRARIQTMDIENVLLEYAATELIDPKILDSYLTLDVLAHSNQLMPANVIVRLGLARARIEELDTTSSPDYMNNDLWPLVQMAWHRNAVNTEEIATKWAKDAVVIGRADVRRKK